MTLPSDAIIPAEKLRDYLLVGPFAARERKGRSAGISTIVSILMRLPAVLPKVRRPPSAVIVLRTPSPAGRQARAPFEPLTGAAPVPLFKHNSGDEIWRGSELHLFQKLQALRDVLLHRV